MCKSTLACFFCRLNAPHILWFESWGVCVCRREREREGEKLHSFWLSAKSHSPVEMNVTRVPKWPTKGIQFPRHVLLALHAWTNVRASIDKKNIFSLTHSNEFNPCITLYHGERRWASSTCCETSDRDTCGHCGETEWRRGAAGAGLSREHKKGMHAFSTCEQLIHERISLVTGIIHLSHTGRHNRLG